jgi:SAM-dependent methyltransferase
MQLVIDSVVKFYSAITVTGFVHGEPLVSISVNDCPAHFTQDERPGDNGFRHFIVQAVVPGGPQPGTKVTFSTAELSETHDVSAMSQGLLNNRPKPLFERFKAMLEAVRAVQGGIKVLDVGGRARSGVRGADELPDWNVVVLDILQDPGVDVVGDAHSMSTYLQNNSFDAVMSISVFEHLLMPWKVAVEISKVLKPGGLAFVHTHQTIGMHDQPWDFWRFSDSSWRGIFNSATGFELIDTSMSEPLHILPMVYQSIFADAERSGGYLSCGVIARKVGEPRVDWQVTLDEAVDTSYPDHVETRAILNRQGRAS